jgi:hypothetical protein
VSDGIQSKIKRCCSGAGTCWCASIRHSRSVSE